MTDKKPETPIQPLELSIQDSIQFQCHPEISCFNQCCQYIDILLTPYDIIRLKNHFDLSSEAFLAQYTYPFEMDEHGMPGVKIKPVEGATACPFVRESGCSVYEDRPSACRYYPVGLLSMRKQDASTDEDSFFLVKEDHCLGHQESRTLTLAAYRQEQGVEQYDDLNRQWRQIILKKRSGGPSMGKPSPRSYQLFFLASYNLDSFRNFIQSDGFLEVYDLEAETLQQLLNDDIALLQFSMQLLKQILFGEMTIAVKEDALEKRIQRRRQLTGVGEDEPNPDYQGPIML
ncbi:MAG: YkgJ family cysteine cluster protein [Pseudomonadota bacterium]|nr:YkgJ family cysteine cluster protein [Pseudomonadota bacterium]